MFDGHEARTVKDWRAFNQDHAEEVNTNGQ